MPAALRWFLRLLPLNPIVVRLVQGASRRGRHNLIRSGYLAVLIAVLLALLLPQQGRLAYQTLAVKGAEAFEIVAYLQIALICILSPVFMAGAIAQESNPRTWEVLLTTPLSAAQMVLGHLFGRLFFVLALLAASMPLFAITQYFGGVPGQSILLSYAVAAGAALVVGATAVALAVSRLAGRRAVFTFYVSVVTYLALTIAVDFSLQPPSGGVTPVTALNPFLALRALLNPTGYPRPDPIDLEAMSGFARLWLGDPVTAWCLVTVSISTVLIIASTFAVRSASSIEGRPSLRRRLFPSHAGSARRARTVWQNPIAWREAAARQATLPKMLARWAFIGAGALWGLALVLYLHGGGMSPANYRYALLATVWTELIVITLVAINVSATAISREREDGTLDLLLTTPITPSEYLGGKLRGLISYLTPLLAIPLGTVAMGSLYTLFNGFGAGGVTVTEAFGVTTIDTPLVLPEGAVIAPLVAAPFIAFCVMIGLQWSMKSKGTIGSVISTVGAVGVVAGIVGLCGWQMGTKMPVIGPGLSASTPVTALLGIIEPASAFQGAVRAAEDLATARVSLLVGSVLAAGIYLLVVYGIRANMVRTFDVAVRRLAGSR